MCHVVDVPPGRDGRIIGITAQSQAKVDGVRQSWGLTFDIFSDEYFVLADHVRALGYVDIAVTARSDYANGAMTQPAVLIINNKRQVRASRVLSK